jgi:hypothetical protein
MFEGQHFPFAGLVIMPFQIAPIAAPQIYKKECIPLAKQPEKSSIFLFLTVIRSWERASCFSKDLFPFVSFSCFAVPVFRYHRVLYNVLLTLYCI